MMATKVFIKKNTIELRSDERDIMVPVDQHLAVLDWCRQNQIQAENPLLMESHCFARMYFGVDIWRVRDEQHRAWFVLRWA